MARTPESKCLLSEFVKADGNNDIMMVNISDGGEPEPLGLNITGQLVGSLKISPDGLYVAIDDVGVTLEVWVTENFLPK